MFDDPEIFIFLSLNMPVDCLYCEKCKEERVWRVKRAYRSGLGTRWYVIISCDDCGEEIRLTPA